MTENFPIAENVAQAQIQLEEELARERLRNEKLRAQLIVYFCLVYIPLTLAVNLLFPQVFPREFQETLAGIPFRYFLTIGGTLLLFYALAVVFLLRRQKQGRALLPLNLIRYLNAFIEISLPTVAIVILIRANILQPFDALTGPPVFAYFLFITLAGLRLDFRICTFTGAMAALQYLSLYGYLYNHLSSQREITFYLAPVPHIVKGAMLLLAGLLIGLVTHQIKKRIIESYKILEERNKVMGIFGQHVSPSVVNKLLEGEMEMESEVREVCIMFLDIRNFTTFSENRSPREVVDFLNKLFGFMIEIINKHHGIINKFLGDGFMAIFGAPLSEGNDNQNAVNASVEIINELEKKRNEGEVSEHGQVGIGLHAGEALTGHVGSEHRKEYTVIGDVVNLAARIESLNKEYRAQLLISEEVWKTIDGPDLSQEAHLGPVKVKGREEPIHIYRLK